jgi:uncharacterized membrane protein YedE/YeeE
MMETSWINGLIGGGLIGLAAAIYLLFNGRIAGMTGILVSSVTERSAVSGRTSQAFLAGAFLAAIGYALVLGAPDLVMTDSVPLIVISGLIVGAGVTVGNGCTSGHGVCGMSRLSKRSIVATLTFMAATAATVAVLRHGLGVI